MWATVLVHVPAASGRLPGPEPPVDVPATLRECWGQGYRWTYWRHYGNAGAGVLTCERVPPARATFSPKLAGDRPKDRRAPSQELDFVSGTLCCYFLFFNLGGDLMYFFHRTFIEREVVVRTLESH